MSALSGRLQRKLTPELLYSQTVFKQCRGARVPGATRWLELDCGRHVLPEWHGDAEMLLVVVVGVEPNAPATRRHRSIQIRSLAGISRLPFRDACRS